jgi:Ca2+-binding RTX toxin-like protein
MINELKPLKQLQRNIAAALVALACCLGNAAWGAPSIQSIGVSPTPLSSGQPFTIAVAASPDAVQAVARIDFRPGDPRALEVPLARQGSIWTGAGIVPADLKLQLPGKAGAMVKAVVLDGAGLRAEGVIQVGVSTNLPFISAVFSGGILTAIGDNQDNVIAARRDAAGALQVSINGNAIPISGGVPTIANTTLIRLLGLNGNDTLLIDDSAGPMPSGNLLGGEGDDILTGSANDDVLEGGPGNDTLAGRDGADVLFGGSGNDILNGGRGADQMFGGDGDDQFVWNPGDGSDVVEGGNGQDTLVFNGANIAEEVDLSANGTRLRFFRNVAAITMDCDGIEQVSFRALGGADQITVNDLTGTQVTKVLLDLSATAGGGDGAADTIVVSGTENNDRIAVVPSDTGAQIVGLSAAITIVGAEPDLDKVVIDGRGGLDMVDFDGSSTNQSVAFSPNAHALRFSSSAQTIIVDCNQVEQVNFHALGAADQIVVNDLTGTTVTNVGIDLTGSTPGAGDGQVHVISVNGTDTNDQIIVTGSAAGINVAGLTAAVTIVGSEPALDRLVINALGGADIVNASALQAGIIGLTLNGGSGNDVLTGSEGNDLLNGGPGADLIFGGPGDDIFPWNPGDGSDTIEGQGGLDTMLFNGANIAEQVDISANGQRLRLFRNVAAITMDCDGIESVVFNALGGADNITVNDLTGTSVTSVRLDLAGVIGSGNGDNSADTVTVNGTTGNDVVTITGNSGEVSILGLAAAITIVGSEPTLDQLVLKLLEGDDVVNASALQAGIIKLILDGGPGADVLVGSAGDDVLLGGEGDDVLEGGPGQDVLDGGPGDNVLLQ